jgi:hypothetical protein
MEIREGFFRKGGISLLNGNFDILMKDTGEKIQSALGEWLAD